VGIVLLSCGLSACGKGSKKSTANPPQVIPTPIVTPIPEPTVAIPAAWVGDWQSLLSDPKYVGNVTYSIRADGKVFISLLAMSKGQAKISAERQEWQATVDKQGSRLEMQLVSSSCSGTSAKLSLAMIVGTNPDMGSIREVNSSFSLAVRRVKGGLTQDIHTAKNVRGYSLEAGCFVGGRLDQFVPTPVARG
jgi:hypothetical protein